MSDNDEVLVFDIETKTFGKPDPDKDELKFFGCYSYKTNKFYLLRDIKSIQKIIDNHKFLVGFNNKDYDIPICERAGIHFKYKTIIDLFIVFDSRSTVIKIKEGLLEDLLMYKSLDFISKLIGVADEETGKKQINYDIFKKDSWTEAEIKEITDYTERDIMVTKRMYEWVEEYFKGLKDFISEKDFNRKIHVYIDPAVLAYKAICYAMKWEATSDFEAERPPKIRGGYVAYPAGEQYDDYVLSFDFDSLYPNIMNQANIYGRKKPEDINDRLTWNGGGVWKVEGIYYADEMHGVSRLIRKWFEQRLEFKANKDPRQNSIKIILNIIYGIMKNPKFVKTRDVIGAGDVTRLGRQFIQYARKRFADAGYELIYGDSVGKDSIIRTRQGSHSIKELFDKGIKTQYGTKEQSFIKDLETLSLDKNKNVIYDKVKKIIRHKTNKKMYKIKLNNMENLIVTEEHSLIWFDNNGNLIERKPKDCKHVIGLKNIPYNNNINKTTYTKEFLQFLGYWIGNGDSGNRKNKQNDKYYFGISTGNDTDEFIEKVLSKLDMSYSLSKNHYDITICSRKVKSWMRDNGFSGNSKTKIVPDIIFNLTKQEITWFLCGLFSADGGCINGIPCLDLINEKILLQIKELLLRVGIFSTIKKENKPNRFDGKLPKGELTYSKRIYVCNRDVYKANIGFIFERKQKLITKSNLRYFAIKQINEKVRTNNKCVLVSEQKTKEYLDIPIRKIREIEEIEYEDYVYDIETENTHMFFANDILVHNTDSIYIYDPFKDRAKAEKLRDEIMTFIRSTLPFPYDKFGMKLENNIKHIYFFKGKGEKETETKDFMSDEFDFFNKPKNLMKKNYIYVTQDDKLTIKNLGIKKKSNSKLSRKIFWDDLVPEIKKGKIKFSKTYLSGLIKKYLSEDISNACLRYNVGSIQQYEKSPNGIYAQIARKHGHGLHFLIPNNKIGVGKGKHYCTVEEFKQNNMTQEDIVLDNIWRELNYFIKPVVIKNIFDY